MSEIHVVYCDLHPSPQSILWDKQQKRCLTMDENHALVWTLYNEALRNDPRVQEWLEVLSPQPASHVGDDNTRCDTCAAIEADSRGTSPQ